MSGPRGRQTSPGDDPARVDLYWIPLGSGGHVVRINGILYEAAVAAAQRRPRRDVYHAALVMDLPSGRHAVEMTPVPAGAASERGVVAEGPVGLRALGRLRIFRYEVRRWHDGVIPDLVHAVASPVRVVDDLSRALRVFDLLPRTPTPTWGRDELRAGEMWTCNSVISWTLAAAGVDLDDVALPPRGRAPGWDAGRAVALRRR